MAVHVFTTTRNYGWAWISMVLDVVGERVSRPLGGLRRQLLRER